MSTRISQTRCGIQVLCVPTATSRGYLKGRRYLLHDRDQKFCADFREALVAGGVKCVVLPVEWNYTDTYAHTDTHGGVVREVPSIASSNHAK